jgi:hypothetical protein
MNRVILSAIALSLLLTGCVKEISIPDPSKSIPSSSPPPSSQPININFNIDGTASMSGFVKNVDSRYIQTLRLLDRTIGTTLSDSNSHYYRFGITKEELKGEKSSQEAQSEYFYDPDNPELLGTQIDHLISASNDSDKLSIIVTDLYLDKNKPYYPNTLKEIRKKI